MEYNDDRYGDDRYGNRRNEEPHGRYLVPEHESRALRGYPQTPDIIKAYPVDDESSIQQYIDVLLRRKKIILAFFGIVVLTTIIGTLLSEPVYKATAKLEISLENPRVVNFDQVVEFETKSDEFYETQYLLLKSKSLAKQVTDKLNLSEHPEFSTEKKDKNLVASIVDGSKSIISGTIKGVKSIIIKPTDEELENEGKDLSEIGKQNSLINKFLGRIDVNPIGNSRLVDISFRSNDRELAAAAVNALSESYIDWIINRKIDATEQGKDFLKQQIQKAQANLEKSEEELNDFAKQSNIVSLDEKMNLTYHTFSELNDALAKAETARLEKEALHSHVQNGNVDALPQVVNDTYVQDLKSELARVRSEYSQLSATFKPGYPKVKELGAKVAELERKINEATTSLAASIESDYQAALKKEETLRKRHDEQKVLASALNEKAIQYNILKREVDTNKSILDSLLQRLKETQVAINMRSSNIQVVDRAQIPIRPYKPNITLNLLFACFIGVMGGVFIAFFMEYFDNTIKSPEEVRDTLKLPVLGGIYELKSGKENDAQQVEKSFLMNPRSQISEAFRTIRTSLLLSTPGQAPRAILVTSCFPSEGKTTVSINLASSFAQAGNSVILLEADLRRPRISKILDKHHQGLSNYLTGNATLDEVIRDGEIPNLSVITVGPIPVNPAELLGSFQMKELIDTLKERYDYVIVDGPPALGFVDSHILSNLVDGVSVVVRAGKTPRESIRELIDRLWNLRANFLGVIVNGIEQNTSGYYYYKTYDYYNTDDEPEDLDKLTAKSSEDGPSMDDFQSPNT